MKMRVRQRKAIEKWETMWKEFYERRWMSVSDVENKTVVEQSVEKLIIKGQRQVQER